MSKPSAPAPPDPRETANAQTGTNVSTAVANTALGNVNQVTPYGSLTYDQTGDFTWTDPYTNQTYTIPRYTATTSLSPEGQAIHDQNVGTQLNLATTGNNLSSFLQDYMGSQPNFDTSAVEGRLAELGRQRLDPMMEERRNATATRLANQGIAQGSEAYNREMGLLGQQENDAYNNLFLSGRGQALNELFATRNQPINEITALLSGSQVQNPMVSMSTPAQIPTTDVAGLIGQNYNQRLGAWQTNQQGRNSLLGGLFSLGAGALTGGYI